jgi:hypothetical protein
MIMLPAGHVFAWGEWAGLVCGSQRSFDVPIQQTPVTVRAAPKNYVAHYVGLRPWGDWLSARLVRR